MSLYLQGSSSCDMQEICMIGAHKTAEEAFVQFCKQSIGVGGDGHQYNGSRPTGNRGAYTGGLGETYVFHGPVDPGMYALVAPRFAAWIVEQGLGTCIAGEPKINRRYHPDHKCQTFIFHPDIPKVEAWWKARPENSLPKPVPPPQPVIVDKSGKCVHCAFEWRYHFGLVCPDETGTRPREGGKGWKSPNQVG